MKVYISGAITNNPGYKEEFAKAMEKLEANGHRVMNPAILPEGFHYDEYMHVCLAMVDVCEVLALLPNYENSPGAQEEKRHAEHGKKWIVYLTD